MVMHCPGYSREFDPTVLFRKILIPIDFSVASRRALITACETRNKFGSEIHLFVERGGGANSGFLGSLGVPWGRDDVEQSGRDQLRYFGESICEGMPCLTNAATYGDDVVHGIADAAKDCGATIVFLPVHEHRNSLFRSRMERIVRSLEVPVLLFKGVEPLADAPVADAESTPVATSTA